MVVSEKATAGMASDGRSMLVPGPRADLCLGFANTLSWRGSTAPVEGLADFAALLAWCKQARTVPPGLARQLSAWSGEHRQRAAEVHAEAIAVREAIYRAIGTLADGKSPGGSDLALLSRAIEEAPARRLLVQAGRGCAWQIPLVVVSPNGLPTSRLLAPVLWSAADLLAGSTQTRVRRCANAKCLWLFLDASKSGSRRWCDMASCGNRAKAQRHYLKSKAS
jgi:predicted RNA-binding Zn ribbon-like protein